MHDSCSQFNADVLLFCYPSVPKQRFNSSSLALIFLSYDIGNAPELRVSTYSGIELYLINGKFMVLAFNVSVSVHLLLRLPS